MAGAPAVMRQHDPLLTLFAWLFALLAGGVWAAPSISIGNASGAAGSNVPVTVTVSDAPGIDSFRLVITYDPVALSYVPGSMSQSGTLSQGFLAVANEPIAGRLIIVAVSTTPISSLSGDLVRFQLHTSASASGTYPLVLSVAESSVNSGAVAATFTGGTLTVSAPATANIRVPTSLVTDPGAVVAVPVDITFSQPLDGFRVAINFDPGAFSFESGSLQTTGLFAGGYSTSVSSTPGRVVVTGATKTALASGDGTLFRIGLRANPSAAGTYPLTLDRSLSELNGGALAITFTDGALRVRSTVRLLSLPAFTAGVPTQETVLPVFLDDANLVDGFRIALTYETAALDFLDYETTGTLAEAFTIVTPVVSPGRVILAGAHGVALGGGSGELMRVRFRVNGSSLGAIPISFDPGLTELNGGNLATLLEGGTITLGTRALALAAPASVLPGEEFMLNTLLSDHQGLDGFRVAITFDATRLAYVPGSFTSTSFPTSAASSTTAGRVVVAGAVDTPLSGGFGSVFSLRFRTLDAASGSTVLTFDPSLTELNTGLIPATLVGTSVSVPARVISIPSIAALPGEEIVVPVLLGPGSGVDGFRVAVDFDANVFTFVEDSESPGILEPDVQLAATSSPGRVVLTGAMAEPLGGASGELLSFRLRADEDGEGVYPLSFVSALTELNGDEIAAALTNGQITLGGRVISIPDGIASSAGSVTVPVMLTNGAGVDGFRLAVDFDPAALLFDNGFAPVGPGGSPLTVNSGTPGRVILTWATGTPLSLGPVTLATFRLAVTGAVGGEVPLTIDSGLTELNGGIITATLDNGSALLPLCREQQSGLTIERSFADSCSKVLPSGGVVENRYGDVVGVNSLRARHPRT